MQKGTTTWNYTYNAGGMRTKRTNGSTTYNYTYHGSQLTHMERGSVELHFSYDASGSPMAVVYNNNTYYYLLNQQGDVVGILDSSGTQVVTYTYDAWGRPLSTTGTMSTTLGQYNPLRYRGYVYDQETGLYYLQSRYYNPTWGRFINADALIATGQGLLGNNMFAYCGNNPVSRIDPTGEKFFEWLKSAWNDACNFFVDTYEYVTNSNEETARTNLDNDGFTFYKGVPVIRADSLGYGAASFGIILMGGNNLRDQGFGDTLNHEYGHFVHLSMIGPVDYFTTTAIPSLVFAEATNQHIFPQEYYYDLPWERTADRLGDVHRSYLPATNTLGSAFWLLTLLYSSTTQW